jgi:methyl-accepting chemotaxis protein
MGLQNCCCENRAATADLKYTVANEAAATRANCDANNQKILDKLCQLEMDNMRQNYENRIGNMQATIDGLRSSLANANSAASQNAQTAQILADNAAQTVALEQYLNPTAIPAYIVQNPNCCGNNGYYCNSCA